MTDPIIPPDSHRFLNRRPEKGDAVHYAAELKRLIEQYSKLMNAADNAESKEQLKREREERIAKLKAKYGKYGNDPYCL